MTEAERNPFRVINQLSEKLGHNAVALQIPIGLEADHKGLVDLVSMKALYFEGEFGDTVREAEIPESLLETARQKREELIDAAAMYSDELTELALEEQDVPEDLLIRAIRDGSLKGDSPRFSWDLHTRTKASSRFSMASTGTCHHPTMSKISPWTWKMMRRRLN